MQCVSLYDECRANSYSMRSMGFWNESLPLPTYVNAGHNAPLMFGDGTATSLPATGPPLGMLSGAAYEAGAAIVPSGGTLLLFTDGLTDSIPGNDPEGRLRGAISDHAAKTMSNLKLLIDPGCKEDDITILLVKRTER